ncbi:hypothetical protein ACP70R_008198 [Stipagrostis hirtigluma subsp. patula]
MAAAVAHDRDEGEKNRMPTAGAAARRRPPRSPLARPQGRRGSIGAGVVTEGFIVEVAGLDRSSPSPIVEG